MRVVISPSCSTTSDSSRSRSPGGSSRSLASTSMFVRRLVSGVRSSCDASATSCRCARVDSSSAASIVLKLAASRLSSSRPLRVDSLREVPVSATCSVASVSRRTGASAARDTSRPSATAIAMPPSGDHDQEDRSGVERVVRRCSSERAIWTRVARAVEACTGVDAREGAVADRRVARRTRPVVRPCDRLERALRGPAAARSPRASRNSRSVRADDLDVAVRAEDAAESRVGVAARPLLEPQLRPDPSLLGAVRSRSSTCA